MDIKKGGYFYRYIPADKGGNVYWDIIKIVKINGNWYDHRTILDFTKTNTKGIHSSTAEMLTKANWKPLFEQSYDVVMDIFIHTDKLGEKRFYM
jgi:hypothetical protein